MSCTETCSRILIAASNQHPVTNLAPQGQPGWALSSPAGNGCDAPRDNTTRSSAPCRNGQRTRPAGVRRGTVSREPPEAHRPRRRGREKRGGEGEKKERNDNVGTPTVGSLPA